jgi:hypothetical protein
MRNLAQNWNGNQSHPDENDRVIYGNWCKPTNPTHPAIRLLTLQIVLQTHNPIRRGRGRRCCSTNKRTQIK